MTTVGWIGLGKLGLTCALTLAHNADGVTVVGYDPDPHVAKILAGDEPPRSREEGLPDLLADGATIGLADDIHGVVANTDGLVFVSVQTPHRPQYGGEVPMPQTRADFDYSYLRQAAEAVSQAADEQGRDITLVIVSTCLPGSVRRHVLPVLSDRVAVIYNPFFIAMGTTVRDFLTPEFVLLGVDRDRPADVAPLLDLYHDLYGGLDGVSGLPQARLMSIESAELTKVAYNTFISMKIVFANTLMEICDGIPGADVDDVTGALTWARDRITSGKYLTAGMGDGGACHPRDNIAMSWLAQTMGLSDDPFEFVTVARERQSDWLARIVADHHGLNPDLPVVLLGKSYKPESDLTYGSPALLLAHQLTARGVSYEHWDWHVDGLLPDQIAVSGGLPSIWVICTRHPEYAGPDLRFPPGSVVIDPFRYIRPGDHPGVQVLGIGADYEGT